MSEPRVGRFLVASLHQAIAEIVPDRLPFYENWLSVSGLRDGRIGLAQLMAVFSFLRLEGDAYEAVTTRAGGYAADWTVNGLSPVERRLMRLLPARFRPRAAVRTVRSLLQATYPGCRVVARVTRHGASLDLRGSVFCQVRDVSPRPLCGFYAAAAARILDRLDLAGEARLQSCRAADGGPGCVIAIVMAAPLAADTKPEGERWSESA
jgi:hypothetical protein